MEIRSRLALAVFLSVVAVAIGGCSKSKLPELGQVQGTVTLDGKPLAEAAVSFYPQSGGRTASGQLDAQGKYELTYATGAKGAKIGMNSVCIEYAAETDAKGPPIPEYARKLQAEVKAGKNTFDFPLDSKKK